MSNFDWIFYTNFYTDIKMANINTEEKALEHYTIHGALENRRIHLDIEKYFKNSEKLGESLFSSINNVSLCGINQQFLTYLMKECKIEPNYKILEIGCGIACLSLPIIKHLKQGKYYGLDNDIKCIDWCRRKISPFCDATFKHINTKHFSIPCDNNELDVVYSTTLFKLMLSEEIGVYLNEINRVLKKGGHLIISLLIWNQSNQMNIKSKNKIRTIKINGNTHLTNSHNETAVIQSDSMMFMILEKAHFEIRETIFGQWSDASNSDTYQDMIHAVKIK